MLLKQRVVHVVPGRGHGQADAIGRVLHVGGNGQAFILPQFLDVGQELLVHVNLARLEGNLSRGVVGENVVANVLGHGQLAPHGRILAPVVVVADEKNLLVIREELAVGAGEGHILRRVVQDGGSVAIITLLERFQPSLLGDKGANQIVLHLQGVHGLAVGVHFGGDDNGEVVLGHHFVNIAAVVGGVAVVDLNADVPGGLKVMGGHLGAVRPFGNRLDFDGGGDQVF